MFYFSQNIQENFKGFKVFGNGQKLLICFHGYGQTNDVYNPISSYTNEYTILSISLPYHSSNDVFDRSLSTNYPLTVYHFIIHYARVHKFKSWQLCGFSIGARLALFCYKQNPKKCDKLFLIAPDGVGRNYFFPALTNKMINPIFKFVMSKNKFLRRVISSIKSIHLISPGLAQFALNSVDSKEKSKRIARTWISLRKARFSDKKLKKILHKYHTPFYLVSGVSDKIISESRLRRFTDLMEEKHHIRLKGNHFTVLNTFFQWFVKQPPSI
ncbi:alpha/beta hydrolase [Flammeovirga yaeyamensis]|uniref:Alpha/beta hydrolase n=1 Tax=Flammeovirga yaeyamensis TaxID=367791 RepID=A0AAX1N0G8_9BACT|nr:MULTISPECIES: alpha/beta hydrolase [Flammeovirga]ANQ47521.1 alpha/beta hydrolase [Flammeovirga sp. MY04]MBB3698560.1 pimeloyl-ACP methyl ester carboxylesterase [Flammeovirga yaeyamensis]NMF34091.1 alpha/beta hydrolase [Flammeovirga yaeyamensis]QWG01079.1 alpha/beta hydrolase [Flammeovirga yaeyamensis]